MALVQLLHSDFFSITEKAALSVVKTERETYTTVYKMIEDYCSKHKIIISNFYTLLNKEDATSVMDRTYKLYVSNPFLHATDLVNEIHKCMDKDPNNIYTRMRTVIEQEEFSIEYNLRTIVLLYKLQKHRTVEAITIIKPVKINELYYMPAEIELIDVYHNLYTMTDHEIAADHEPILYEQVFDRKEKGIIGSGSGFNCKDNRRELLEAIKISLVKNWLDRKSTRLNSSH